MELIFKVAVLIPHGNSGRYNFRAFDGQYPSYESAMEKVMSYAGITKIGATYRNKQGNEVVIEVSEKIEYNF